MEKTEAFESLAVATSPAAVPEPVAQVVGRRICNITKHFAERWSERILEIAKEVKDKKIKEQLIKEYAAMNFERIKEQANITFGYATYIWEGQLYDNITKKYYIEDDIIFVVDTSGDALRTVYKVDFGFPGAGNTQARKALIEEIHQLSVAKEELDFKLLMQTESKESELEQAIQQIQVLQEQLKNMQEKKAFIEQEMKHLHQDSYHLDLEIKKYTSMLVNSKEYREDLKNM